MANKNEVLHMLGGGGGVSPSSFFIPNLLVYHTLGNGQSTFEIWKYLFACFKGKFYFDTSLCGGELSNFVTKEGNVAKTENALKWNLISTIFCRREISPFHPFRRRD